MRLVVVLLITVLLGGCASNPPAPADVQDGVAKLLEDLPVEEVFVAASDGTRMHNAVYRPDTDEPVPVFINFSPYWGNTAEQGGDAFAQYLIETLVPQGYAVVLSAVRGTGHSGGCFEVASDREVEDLYDVIDFFANEPWSSGAVAAGGKSYDSTTQNGLIAKMPHPALKGLFHVSGITDMYRYNYVNGVPYSNGLTFTPRYATTYSQDGAHPEGEPYNVIDMACPEMAEHAMSGTGSAVHGLKDDYWQERDWNRHVPDWNGSIFFVHGLQDWNVKPDHILPWIGMLPEQIRVKGWLHQDSHPGSGGHVYPMRTDWNETLLAWLETELRGEEVGFWDAPAWDIHGTDGLWREMEAWPPIRHPDGLQGTVTGGDTVRITFAEGARITGAPVIHVGATVANPDSILTATLEHNGEWVGEAVLRAVYRDGLEAPAPPSAGQVTFHLEAYPLDVVFRPGDELDIVFGGMARHSITSPAHLAGVTYNLGTVSVQAFVEGIEAREDQPQPMPCITC